MGKLEENFFDDGKRSRYHGGKKYVRGYLVRTLIVILDETRKMSKISIRHYVAQQYGRGIKPLLYAFSCMYV